MHKNGTTDTTNRYRISYVATNVSSNKSTDKSSHFKYLSMYSADEEHLYLHDSGVLYVFVSKTRFATLEAFKTYLSEQYANGTPVMVEYKKATETVMPFTKEQQEVYNKLRLMYEGYNKITCTDKVKPELEVTYYYNNDLNKTYAKRLDEIEKKIDLLLKQIQ